MLFQIFFKIQFSENKQSNKKVRFLINFSPKKFVIELKRVLSLQSQNSGYVQIGEKS